MKEYYHVSYIELFEGQILNLNSSQYKVDYEEKGLYSDNEVKLMIIELFPNGISHHGLTYLTPNFTFPLIESKNYIEYVTMIECTFEYMRRLKFVHLPSRFESVFACKNIEDAIKLKENYRKTNHAKIYKITSEISFEADMNFLKMGRCILSNFTIAEKYWSGKKSENPFNEILLKENVRVIEEIKK